MRHVNIKFCTYGSKRFSNILVNSSDYFAFPLLLSNPFLLRHPRHRSLSSKAHTSPCPNHQHQPTNTIHSLTQTLNTPPPHNHSPIPPPRPTSSSSGEIISEYRRWTLHSGSDRRHGVPFPLPVTRYLDKVHSSPRVNFLGANTLSWCSASSLFD